MCVIEKGGNVQIIQSRPPFKTGLQNRCGSIFALLAKAACSEQYISKLRRTKDVLRLKLQNKATNLHTSHALSMEVLLARGLELGSHGSDCWPHVFT